jgi:hypothetical protein
VRVGNGGGFQCCLGGLMPEAGVGEKAGAALGVMDDRDFEERVSSALAAGQLLDEEGKEGDVVDNGLGDAAPRVADDGSISELESKDDRGSTRWSRQATTTCAVGRPSAAGG